MSTDRKEFGELKTMRWSAGVGRVRRIHLTGLWAGERRARRARGQRRGARIWEKEFGELKTMRWSAGVGRVRRIHLTGLWAGERRARRARGQRRGARIWEEAGRPGFGADAVEVAARVAKDCGGVGGLRTCRAERRLQGWGTGALGEAPRSALQRPGPGV